MDLSWMTAFSDPRYSQGFVHHPVRATVNGLPWAIATNGHIFVAVREVKPSEFPQAEAAEIPTLAKFLTDHGSGTRGNLAKLRAWCGPPQKPTTVRCPTCGGPGRVQCQECTGTGRAPYECPLCGGEHKANCEKCKNGRIDCPKCKGTGTVYRLSKIGYGRIGPALINRALLGRALAHLPGKTVAIAVFSPTAPLYVDGPNWRIVLMPMDSSVTRAPKWPLAPPR